MRLRYRVVCCLISLTGLSSAALPSHAATTSATHYALTNTELNALANDAAWQSLLHINQGSTLHDRHKSYVDDANFFLSPNGKKSALDELQASIEQLSPDQSEARCRFPARFHFLAEKLAWNTTDALSHCAKYLEWRQQIPSARAVLIFPASYLNSPSSMFGHTLLRLDAARNPDDVWSSWAVNFGAATDARDNSLLYVWRGLGGGYPSGFGIVPYVTKIQEYSNLENRDIWEYSLRLTPEEMARLIDHLWELQNINFDYFFLDENCSFRLLGLLQVAKPESPLTQGFRLTEAPVNTVRTLADHGLIENYRYRPSKASELLADVDALSAEEQKISLALLTAAQDSTTYTEALKDLNSVAPERQHLIARTAFRAQRFKTRKRNLSADEAERNLGLLKLMQATPSTLNPQPLPPTPPERGHNSQLLSLGFGQAEGQNNTEIRYRLAYHGHSDNPQGFLKGAELETFDLKLKHNSANGLRVDALNVINIRSVSPRNRFIQPLSWTVRTGLERLPLDSNRLQPFVQGGAGFSWEWQGLQPYSLGVARLEHPQAASRFFQGGVGLALGLLHQGPRVQINSGLEAFKFTNGATRLTPMFEINIPTHINNSLRLHWHRQQSDVNDSRVREDEWRISWQHYFH